MRLLHTSDFHLGAKWGEVSREADHERVLEEILLVAERHNVDALLVTGDIFGGRVEKSIALEARRLLERLRSHLEQGRAIVLLRGNHDPIHLFSLIAALVEGMGGERWPLVVADEPRIYTLPGHRLQIVALPYLAPNWLRQTATEFDRTPEEQLAGLTGLLALYVERLYEQVSPELPAVFAGHILISGAKLTQDLAIESGYHQELSLAANRLPQFTSYNALGHIHLGQEVRGAGKPTWYAGAPDRLDIGERAYHPQVLIVTVPDSPGGAAAVEPVPLTTCTPFVLEDLTGEDAVERFCEVSEAADWPSDPLGRVTVSAVPVGRRALVEARLRDVAPRIEIRWASEAPIGWHSIVDEFDPHDVSAVVDDYLDRHFADQPEHRDRLAAAFAELWQEGVR
jgi:DNA repair protein SbcD/Mre11